MIGKMNSTVISGMSYELLYLVSYVGLQVCQVRTIGSLVLPAKWSSLPFTKNTRHSGANMDITFVRKKQLTGVGLYFSSAW